MNGRTLRLSALAVTSLAVTHLRPQYGPPSMEFHQAPDRADSIELRAPTTLASVSVARPTLYPFRDDAEMLEFLFADSPDARDPSAWSD